MSGLSGPVLGAALAAAWLLRLGLSWQQSAHYRRTLNQLMAEGGGYVATGHSPSRWGRGAVALILGSGDGHVRRAFVMQGATVFARFRELPELRGVELRELAAADGKGGVARALAQAAGRILKESQG